VVGGLGEVSSGGRLSGHRGRLEAGPVPK
jgi:hypothetical protein